MGEREMLKNIAREHYIEAIRMAWPAVLESVFVSLAGGYYRYTHGFLYGYICSSGYRVNPSAKVSKS